MRMNIDVLDVEEGDTHYIITIRVTLTLLGTEYTATQRVAWSRR